MGKVFKLIQEEERRQETTIELIASENFVSNDVLRAVGSCLTNKYAEGYPSERASGNRGRYYGGTYVVDKIEEYCCDLFKQLYNTDYHVNVQPHCGSAANMAAYFTLLRPGDRILSMSLDCGGHLSHGARVSFSGKLYNVFHYGVNAEGFIDYDEVERLAKECRPNLIVAGASAYSRIIDFERFRSITDTVGAYLVVDMAHIAGLIAAGEHPTPFGFADMITTTTHKTLRGPRGGLVFCKPEYANALDKTVFPCLQGGPLMHVIAGKAVCAEEAMADSYKEYIKQVICNASTMANEFINLGYKVVSGGTDNHLFLLDLTPIGVSGRYAQEKLDAEGITLNKNAIPNDPRPPKETSGVRIGTAAMTTKGYKAEQFINVARLIHKILISKEGVSNDYNY